GPAGGWCVPFRPGRRVRRRAGQAGVCGRGGTAVHNRGAGMKEPRGTGQDGPMRETRVSAAGLREAIEHSGYYPDLVADAVESALGKEPVVAYVVHHETTFDPGMEVRRHITVVVLS